MAFRWKDPPVIFVIIENTPYPVTGVVSILIGFHFVRFDLKLRFFCDNWGTEDGFGLQSVFLPLAFKKN